MRKIGEMNIGNGYGKMTIYHDEKAEFPYRVYREYNELTEHGIKHRKRIHSYTRCRSMAMRHVWEFAFEHDTERMYEHE